jgi:hypothetical protein
MSLTANSAGVVTGKFLIPANVPAGSKRVVFTGAGGSTGEANFIGQGMTVIENRQVVTSVNLVKYDPLAETFTLDSAQQISGIDIWFTARGTSPVEIQIRETSVGFPTQVILAAARKPAAQIHVDGTPTRFSFTAPVALQPSAEYALTVLCDDGTTEVAIAELGKFDSIMQRWVTAQPYQVGVLLSSSNASTWTAHQDKDLTFQLVRANFSVTSKEIPLGSIQADGVTDLMVRANIEAPSSQTGCEFKLTLPDNSVHLVASDQPVQLDSEITGTVSVAAILRGTATESPVLHRDVQVLCGTLGTSGDYYSRAITAGQNVRNKVIIEAYLPGSASITVTAIDADNHANHCPMSVASSVTLDDGWVELTYTDASAITANMLQVHIALSGSPAYRPRSRRLRHIVL